MGVEHHGRWNWLLVGLLLVYRNDSTVSGIEALFFLCSWCFFFSIVGYGTLFSVQLVIYFGRGAC